MLNNYGAHALDQLLTVTGYEVARLFCELRRVASIGDAEDVVKLIYETRSGAIGEADINQACAIAPYEFEVYGTRGAIAKHDSELHVRYLSSRRLPPKDLDATLASADRRYPSDNIRFTEKRIAANPKYQVDVYRDFARAIRKGRPPFVTCEQVLSLMRILERCRKEAGGIRDMLVVG